MGLLLLCLTGCLHAPREDKGNCKEIHEYVKMEASISKEVFLGDSMDINISYINISDSLIIFYPTGYISFWKPKETVYFDIPNGEAINTIIDYRIPVIIKPKEKHSVRYFVKPSRPLFHVGIIGLELAYRIGYEKEVKNELCRRIESNVIQVRVKGVGSLIS